MTLDLLLGGPRWFFRSPQPSQNLRICLPKGGHSEQSPLSFKSQLRRSWQKRFDRSAKALDGRRGTDARPIVVRRRLALSRHMPFRVKTAFARMVDPRVRSGKGNVLQRDRPRLQIQLLDAFGDHQIQIGVVFAAVLEPSQTPRFGRRGILPRLSPDDVEKPKHGFVVAVFLVHVHYGEQRDSRKDGLQLGHRVRRIEGVDFESVNGNKGRDMVL